MFDEDYEFRLERTTYVNGNLAVLATDNKTEEPFGIITVNTGVDLPDDQACVDINNLPDILDTIFKAGLAKPTMYKINPGGFVDYPIVVFDLNKIPETNND
jgi:hypothetical protein